MLKKLIHRPIAVFTILVAALVLGITVMRNLPVSLVPEVDIPLITVKVSDPNSSAREIHQRIVTPLRTALVQVSSLTSLDAVSRDGSGIVEMSFEYGANMDLLFVEVNERIDRIMSTLPRDVERPKVLRSSATDLPVYYINVGLKSGSTSSDSLLQLSEFVREVIVRRIEQVEEVAMVDVSGLVQPQVLITPDADKLKMAGIGENELIRAIEGADVTLGNIIIRDGEYSFNVRFETQLVNKTDIENLYLKVNDRIFQFKELATVEMVAQERSGMVTSDGSEAISMAVIKRSQARMEALQSNISELMKHIEKDYPQLEFTITRDQTALLDYSINNLISNILMGAALACLMIFLFMQNLRLPMLVVFTIPTSLIVSFLFFYIFDISINIISLSGLVLGVGMMVDNSIVTVDNITFCWRRGGNLAQACVQGTMEVFMPMVSAVLTTCAVFVPLIFLSGISGALFFDQAMAVVITLGSALLVTILVLPTLYYIVYRKKERFTTNRFLSFTQRGNLTGVYERILKWNMRRQWFMWLCFAGSIISVWAIYDHVEKEKLPPMSYNDALVSIEWNERLTPEVNARRTDELFKPVEGQIEQITIMAGVQQFVMSHTAEQSLSQSLVYIKTPSVTAVDSIRDYISGVIAKNYPEAHVEFESSGNIFEMIFSGGSTAVLSANLRPTSGAMGDLNALNELLAKIDNHLNWSTIPAVEWGEHTEFVTRPDMMALYNVTHTELLTVLRGVLHSNNIATIATGNESLPIILGGQKEALADILGTNYIDRKDYIIPLDRLLIQTAARDLKNITSGGDGEYYALNLNLDADQVGMTIDVINEVVRQDSNFEVDFAGSYFEDRELVGEMTMVLIISVLLLYFILSAQFESLLQPLIILFELIIDIAGAIILLWAMGASLNLMSLIGIVVMCGIVINDSILKVDTINKLRAAGTGLTRAVMEAGARRLKPILMTSLTTILSMMPFLVTGDMGSDLQYPLAVAVISGMVVGTLVSVFFVPLIYYTIYSKKRR